MIVRENDVLKMDSENGMTYTVEIISINEFRPSDEKYAIDLIDGNGNRYSDSYGDVYFCGDDFINNCYK